MDLGAKGNIFERQGVPRHDIDVVTGHHSVANPNPDRLENVTLFSIGVRNERDARRTIRIVLNRRHDTRNVFLVALEIDNAIGPLVATSPLPNRHPSPVIPSPGLR